MTKSASTHIVARMNEAAILGIASALQYHLIAMKTAINFKQESHALSDAHAHFLRDSAVLIALMQERAEIDA